MSKKVFPMHESAHSARQRADVMLGRDAGVQNLTREELQNAHRHMGQMPYDEDNQGAAPYITSR